jgi:hypothetical protein
VKAFFMQKHGFISGFLFFFVQMISEKTNASGAFAYTKMTVIYRCGTIFLNKWRPCCAESRTVYRRGRNEKTKVSEITGCFYMRMSVALPLARRLRQGKKRRSGKRQRERRPCDWVFAAVK